MNDKPKYDPAIHHRRSIRLKDYDYSQAGAYFITICVKDKAHLFGKIINGEMHLNDAGKMIDKWWQKIPEKFPDIELGEYQIMPNHFHAIAINVGADPRVCPKDNATNDKLIITDDINTTSTNKHTQQWNDKLILSNDSNDNEMDIEQLIFDSTMHEGEHLGSPLHRVVQWFKTMTTNEYIRNVKQNGWAPFNGKLWQRNYYEHIIRNEKSFQRIAKYIYNNPVNWDADKFFAE